MPPTSAPPSATSGYQASTEAAEAFGTDFTERYATSRNWEVRKHAISMAGGYGVISS